MVRRRCRARGRGTKNVPAHHLPPAGQSSSASSGAAPASSTAAADASAADANAAFRVGMTCEGCANAVKRVLGKQEGVTSVVTDVAAKHVTVHGAGARDPRVLEALQKWAAASGKEVAAL